MSAKRIKYEAGFVNSVSSEFLSQISKIENNVRIVIAEKDRQHENVLKEKCQVENELKERTEEEIKKWRKTIEDDNKKHIDIAYQKDIQLKSLTK